MALWRRGSLQVRDCSLWLRRGAAGRGPRCPADPELEIPDHDARASGWILPIPSGAHTGQIGISTKFGNLNAGPLIRPNREFRAIPGGHADPAVPAAKSPGPGIPESRAGGYFPAGQLEAGTGQGAGFGDFATVTRRGLAAPVALAVAVAVADWQWQL